MKKLISLLTLFSVLISVSLPVQASSSEENTDKPTSTVPFEPDALSAVLMEEKTGRVLYAKNETEALPPASVTKIMTLLLVMEAIDSSRISMDDVVTISEYASSMGGSQVYLECGEEFTVRELLKCAVIASANDASVALAEHVCGSESAFVEKMNQRARELGMVSTKFENVTGLDDTTVEHVTSAHDIAVMSRELISHRQILEYSSTWMDTIRDGAFTLTNTNRLVKYYPGATGLKTGSTEKAGFCVSVTAEREGMGLICVIMGAPSRDARNTSAAKLLDYGFANYSVYKEENAGTGTLTLCKGENESIGMIREPFYTVIEKGKQREVRIEENIPSSISAPVKKGDKIGSICYYVGSEKIGEVVVCAAEDAEGITFFGMFMKMLKSFLNPT